MYLHDMLSKAILSEDIAEGDLLLVSSSTVSWADVPMIIRRADWDSIFVTYRAKEPDIEIIGKLLASGKCSSFLTRFANEEEIRSAYQTMRNEYECAARGKDAMDMDYDNNIQGFESEPGEGITPNIPEDENSHPTVLPGAVGTVTLCPDDNNSEAPVDILAGAFDTPVMPYMPPVFDAGGGDESCLEEESVPLCRLTDIAPLTDSHITSSLEEETASSENVEEDYNPSEEAEGSFAPDEKEVEETSESFFDDDPEQSHTSEISEQGNIEPFVEKEVEEEPSNALEKEYQEAFDFCLEFVRSEAEIPPVELTWDGGLTKSFKHMSADFDEVFAAAPVEVVIGPTYSSCENFNLKLLNAIEGSPADIIASCNPDVDQFKSMFCEAYIACLYFILHDDTETARGIFNLFANLIYEDGDSNG